VNPEPKIRVFVALKTPPQWDDALEELQKELKLKVASDAIRWTSPLQFHLTLRFLGFIPSSDVERLITIIDSVTSTLHSFELRYDGPGCFPRVKSPRVIWAGLKTESSQLDELYQRLINATKEIGEPPEDRPFKPHLTLARVKNLEKKSIPLLEQALGSSDFRNPGAWVVDQVALMQSRLSPKGATYETIHVSKLKLE
jgi:2'-5' RNA ligase